MAVNTSIDATINQYGIEGLTAQEVLTSREMYGGNDVARRENNFLHILFDLIKEPMLILLLVAASLYFVSGNTSDGFFMLFAIMLVTSISLYQEARSRNALAALRSLTQPTCKVIREKKVVTISKEEIVLGDFMIVEEGSGVPADGVIIQSNDFSVNESILTGESLPVSKTKTSENNFVYQGTTIVGGLAICRVNAIGHNTALGKIGESLEVIEIEDTPLQKQINNFVKKMTFVGVVIFFIVWSINFFTSYNVVRSLLQSLTLAMSILPEEIPVAFATFMALGAWRLMKLGIIVKNTSTVETLGSSTVICTDKTGTLTENRMALTKVFALSSGETNDVKNISPEHAEVITLAMWSSEPIPFDPMEVALHDAYTNLNTSYERNLFKLVHEYPLGGRPPMMTHVFENSLGKRIIAAKGAPEAMIKVSKLSESENEIVTNAILTLTASGYRVLGVGVSDFDGTIFPINQQELPFTFKGLVAFYDPPKSNIASVLQSFYNAGIQVKIITGDNAATTSTIAKQIGFHGCEKTLSGEELVNMTDDEIKQKVGEINIFTRMFPDAKLKIVNALKANGQIVAMTGDGVNDGPALKAAHISIAMGQRGSEIAKEVSSLVLTDDDLAKMVDAIAMGRKIYANLKKAIQYIISIHIPIILTVFIPLALGWIYPSILTPVHVIFLELIMGPTCSIIYENEPIEKNAMMQTPRHLTITFFNWKELRTSIIQGLMITAATLLIYQYAIHRQYSEGLVRAMVFITLITSNIFLTLVNRSFYFSLLTTLRYKNDLVLIIIAVTTTVTLTLLYITPFAQFFQFETPNMYALVISSAAGCLSVIWFEVVKMVKRKRGTSVS
jgi:Ca2+-transporting ATPase